ncbi:MAG: homoserine O-acetyltransferase [Proteobacteria bacterium]|nr:homoserine O-acetyltransferase [Pseudomonadota bacterium]MBU1233322.1 homoserine O-acetyltransferase [Pseudomonadota bacterium]MBU1420336.1 homoserine O-acetyltransferase [Pseudomonadota bacterium]MBU1456713.1 homoserine O-acetyltransferase [Pseudomonadota bacterium]
MLCKRSIHHFARPLTLISGKTLPAFTLAYETYGQLNEARDNAILLCHGLTATPHAAGEDAGPEVPKGWWNMAIGHNKVLDTDRWFIICIGALGGFCGSTGPASINPETDRPYGLSFPVVTISDMVNTMKQLTDILAIERYHCLIGGCMGGFQVLDWLVRYPEKVGSSIIMGATARTSAHSLALWEVVRRAIVLDPDFHGGDYYDKKPPKAGISLGTMFGMLVWMSREVMEKKFGRSLCAGSHTPAYSLEPEFAIQKFLSTIEDAPKGPFDANSFIYLTKAMDYFDLEHDHGSLEAAFAQVKGKTLLVSFDSDWRYPQEEVDKIRLALEANQAPVEHRCLHSDFGHGAFLYDFHNGLDSLIEKFLS